MSPVDNRSIGSVDLPQLLWAEDMGFKWKVARETKFKQRGSHAVGHNYTKVLTFPELGAPLLDGFSRPNQGMSGGGFPIWKLCPIAVSDKFAVV